MGWGRVCDWLVHFVLGAMVLKNGVGSAVPVTRSESGEGRISNLVVLVRVNACAIPNPKPGCHLKKMTSDGASCMIAVNPSPASRVGGRIHFNKFSPGMTQGTGS